MITTIRKCRDCGIEANNIIELVLFVEAKNCKYGVKNLCRGCNKFRALRWREDNQERSKEVAKQHRCEKRYNITLEEYNKCMETSVVCEICGGQEELVYDHDHITMKFRGVLCRQCNSGIGFLGDTEDSVLRAYEYLKEKK